MLQTDREGQHDSLFAGAQMAYSNGDMLVSIHYRNVQFGMIVTREGTVIVLPDSHLDVGYAMTVKHFGILAIGEIAKMAARFGHVTVVT